MMSGCTETLYLEQAQLPGSGSQWDGESWGWWLFYSHLFLFSTNMGPEGTQLCCLISSESIRVAVTLPSTSHSGLRGDQCKPPAPTMALPSIPTFAPTALIKLCWCGTSTSTTWTWSGKVPMCVKSGVASCLDLGSLRELGHSRTCREPSHTGHKATIVS